MVLLGWPELAANVVTTLTEAVPDICSRKRLNVKVQHTSIADRDRAACHHNRAGQEVGRGESQIGLGNPAWVSMKLKWANARRAYENESRA